MLAGEGTGAQAWAMRILVAMARAVGTRRLLDISGAHIDGVLYLGEASRDFAIRLRDLGGQVAVPTTLNVSSLDLLHPELFRGEDRSRQAAQEMMSAYVEMGAAPTWTCAPYQLAERPGLGDRVAWGESNAIVFANTVLGARTPRFGDFADMAAAVCGRAPEFGLYLDRNRRARIRFDVSTIPEPARHTDEFFAVLGLVVGGEAGSEVPVITGITEATEDQLKMLGAAAATSGAVGMLHVVGITPEAPTLDAAVGGTEPRVITVTREAIRRAYQALTSTDSQSLRTVNLGTPHYSSRQLARLADLLSGRPIHRDVTMYVNTGRDTLAACAETVRELEALGVVPVTDTCTYVTPIIPTDRGTAMTDSAKWAYYAPGNLGVEVVFGSTADCVESAVAGRVILSRPPW